MNALRWLEDSFSLTLIQTLLHFLWQGSLIAVVTFVADQWMSKSAARIKYAVYVTALIFMLACVPVTFSILRVAGQEPSAAIDSADQFHANTAAMSSIASTRPEFASRVALGGDIETAGLVPPRLIRGVESVASAEAASTISTTSTASTVSPRLEPAATSVRQWSRDWLAPYASYLSILYVVGVLVMFARLMRAVWGGHQLRQTAEYVTEDRLLLETLDRQTKRLGLKVAPAIAVCNKISVPIVMGIVRPVIVLPATLATGLSPDQLQAVIAHELAHLRRFDLVVNLLQRLIEAMLFFHPAVWYVSYRINVLREHASDDLVVATGCPKIRYADALVRMAELSASCKHVGCAGQATTAAATGHNSSEFKSRVLRLLEDESPNVQLTGWGLCSLVFLVLIGISTLVFMPAWAAPFPDQNVSEPAAENNKSATDGARRHVGRKIDDFALRDYLGAEYRLGNYAESRLVVVAFLGADCPLAKLYGPRLKTLADQYQGRGVRFLGINSNQQDTPTDIGNYVRRHGITFPLLKDPGNKVADQLGAERTPEVFLLDERRTVRFWGCIDDQFGVGYSRPEPTRQFLMTALDEILAGKEVSQSEVPSVGCHIGRVLRNAPTGDITYTKQIAPILQRRCIECHRRGGIAPFAMDSYAEVAGWAETIRDVMASERMPPWHANPKFGHFANDQRMPEEEKQLIYRWIENGIPEGNAADLPPPATFVDGWSLGRPDLVVSMPTAFSVSRDGVVPYQYFTVDPGFTEGRWVRASEVRPGVRSVVHHVIVFINPPGGDPILEEKGVGFEMVGSYVPGTPPMQLADGVARYVPPGSTFVFQMHYTPDGTEQRDKSEIGLYFANPSTVRRTMQTGVAVNLDFTIPPNAVDYPVEASHRFDHDMEVHALIPHMHFRGKAFRFEAVYPNGSREILLDVPRFDFNWQNTYRLKKPKLLPEGTLLRCTALFDNSEHNLSNPDPSIPVKWGEQTWEEMMIGYFEGVFLNQDLELPEPRITPLGNDEYRVHFSYRPDRTIRSVTLAGTFNEWNTSSHPLEDENRDGVFELDLKLKRGPYRYKFVIDGNYWSHDPASRILTGIFHESFFVAGNEPQHGSASKP